MKFIKLLMIITFWGSITNAQKVVKVEIHSIPLLLETDSDIRCDENLDSNFPNDIIIKKIVEQTILKKIRKLLLGFESSNEKSIDVRGYLLIIYESDKSRKICFNRFGDFYEFGRYSTNRTLFDFLKMNNLIEKNRTKAK